MRISRILPLLVFTFFSLATQAQITTSSSKSKTYKIEYYIYLSGITSREDVVSLESSIGQKTGVSYFMANRYPVRYFLLRADRTISLEEFKSWLPGNKFKVEVFGSDPRSKEKTYLLYKKNKTNN